MFMSNPKFFVYFAFEANKNCIMLTEMIHKGCRCFDSAMQIPPIEEVSP